MKILLNNVTDISKTLIELLVRKSDTAIDMTMGNGNDTLLLSECTGDDGFVYAFDVQKEAVENTRRLLGERKNVRLVLDSHENVKEYVKDRVDFIIYNLGYLPGHDRTVKTEAGSTVRSLEAAVELMKEGAKTVICAYLGHEGGMEEYRAVTEFAGKLPKKSYNVLSMMHLNRRQDAPRIVIIEKIGK